MGSNPGRPAKPARLDDGTYQLVGIFAIEICPAAQKLSPPPQALAMRAYPRLAQKKAGDPSQDRRLMPFNGSSMSQRRAVVAD